MLSTALTPSHTFVPFIFLHGSQTLKNSPNYQKAVRSLASLVSVLLKVNPHAFGMESNDTK